MAKEEDFSNEDIITPERLAKGDLRISFNSRGKIKTAEPMDKFIIRELIRKGTLENHHEIYGVGFLELRAAFRAPWASKSCAVLLEQWGSGMSISKATEIYQKVCRGMRAKGIEVIEFALENESKSCNYDKYDRGLYKEHFDRLVTLMDEERERMRREREKFL